MEPENLCQSADIAEAAAQAARDRESSRSTAGTDKLPQPEVVDLDAFRSKVMAKTQRFNKYVDRSQKQRENMRRGVKLAWLRTGQDASGLGDFQETLRKEASAIEAEDLAAAEVDNLDVREAASKYRDRHQSIT